jgi:hypothetical protein
MPREPRSSSRLLPRLARLVIGHNGLRRRSDRIEGGLIVMLSAVFLAVVVATSLIAAHIYRSQRMAAARLHPVAAVLSQTGPSDILTGYGQVRARWRAPDGQQRAGTLTTDTAPGIWNAPAGARVRVWVTASGQPAAPPPGRSAMILSALLVPFWGAGTAAVVLVICYWLGRLMLDRRRLADWESAWALTGPRWTSRR